MSREAAELVEALDRCRARLHALRGVVGSGVGLRDGEPVVEVHVEGPGDAELARAIRRIVEVDFVLVPWSGPADAQGRPSNRKE